MQHQEPECGVHVGYCRRGVWMVRVARRVCWEGAISEHKGILNTLLCHFVEILCDFRVVRLFDYKYSFRFDVPNKLCLSKAHRGVKSQVFLITKVKRQRQQMMYIEPVKNWAEGLLSPSWL